MNFKSLVLIATCVSAVFCSGEHEFKLQIGHLKEIPKRFDILQENAIGDFTKYINDIRDLAQEANVTVKYKVKVEVLKPDGRRIKKKEKTHKGKSKKYIVPLKRKNMKLSNLEIIMRKHMDSLVSKANVVHRAVPNSTEKAPQVLTTRSMYVGKYKPIVRLVRTNYTKIVKPVRNKIITLTFEPVLQ